MFSNFSNLMIIQLVDRRHIFEIEKYYICMHKNSKDNDFDNIIIRDYGISL